MISLTHRMWFDGIYMHTQHAPVLMNAFFVCAGVKGTHSFLSEDYFSLFLSSFERKGWRDGKEGRLKWLFEVPKEVCEMCWQGRVFSKRCRSYIIYNAGPPIIFHSYG